MTQPNLSAIQLLEVAEDVAGAFAGSILAQLGARVLKVESPDRGDLLRSTPTGRRLFAHLNAGKQSLTLSPGDREAGGLLEQLVASSHCVLRSSNEPLHFDELHGLAGGTILCCLTPFGESGPLAGYRATPMTLNHAGGEGYMLPGGREYIGSPPARGGRNASEYDAGWHAALAILASLWTAPLGARPNGERAHIDIAKREATLAVYSTVAANFINDQAVPSRNSVPIAVGGCLPCADGYVQVFAPTEAAWQAVCRMLGEPDWTRDQRFATPASREKHQDELNTLMIGVTIELTKAEILDRALAAGCPTGPYFSASELLASAQLAAREALRDLTGDDVEATTAPAAPWQFPAGGPPRAWTVPALGSANSDLRLLAEALSPDPSPSACAEVSAVGARRTNGKGPLGGVRILDLTWAVGGPVATRFLAYLGAEVIRIESRAKPDLSRLISWSRGKGPDFSSEHLTDLDASTSFAEYNVGKKSLALNLAMPEAQELVRRLAPSADVLISTMRPGVMEKMGLGWETLSALNPKLVLVSESASGRIGPQRDLAGFASIFGAMSGIGQATGFAGGPPTEFRSGADSRVGLVIATAVVAGLNLAKRNGQGTWLDLSAIEGLLSFCPEPLFEYQATGVDSERIGNDEEGYVPSGVYACAGDDDWLALSVRSEPEWREFADEAGLGADARFATAELRAEHRVALDDAIQEWTRPHDKADLMRRLQARGLAATVVYTARDCAGDEQLAARGAWHISEHSVVGQRTVLRPPWRNGIEGGWALPAPLIGEHTEALLGELLGLSPDEVASLRERKIAW